MDVSGFGSVSLDNDQSVEPLRGELLSIEHLRVHAVNLANSLKVHRDVPRERTFHKRLKQNSEFLYFAHRTISSAIRDGEPLTPEAEWLLDNFYVVEEHLKQIHDDLPPGYFDELPKLENRMPRVYQLALDLIVHTDSVIQRDDLAAFVEEFQSVTPLSIGEMWAMPIMLRLALVENLCRLSRQMVKNLDIRRDLHSLLNDWRAGEPVPEVLRSDPPRPEWIANSFTILGDLFSNDPSRFASLEQTLMEQFPSSSELIRTEHRRQAANQVTIGNVITSMRLISAMDWMKFFETTSLTERVLRQDPTGVYSSMDPDTRNRYRHAIEDIARHSQLTDLEVANRALAFAQRAPVGDLPPSISNHIGYWLVDEGRKQFERELGYCATLGKFVPRWMVSHPGLAYFGSASGIIILGVALGVMLAITTGLSWPISLFLLCAAAFPLSEFAISLTNWLVTHLVPPRLLPKMELKDGVPAELRTFVIVPAMLTSKTEVAALLERLELHYVGNCETQLRFALLTDFADAPAEEMETDAALVEQAVAGIDRLNDRYSQNGVRPFYLFHRSRKWNDREGVWMGWERKRGKLVEFNRLLLGSRETSYSVIEGDLSVLENKGIAPAIPFVITLDADTKLPIGTARRLIGALAHPLNRAQIDPDETRVLRGFTILQPRVSVNLADGNKSQFTRLFAGAKGIDPYATAASDVYQDLFGEGSFTGKGIYDVRSFETILHNAFDENRILSHDLIEGCHARVGLVSDVEVIDGYPAQYDSDARRNHRWVRGDWQILPWLFRTVPSRRGRRHNPLSGLSRWKIFDNLRRSLVAPATCLLLIISWYLVPGQAAIWNIVAWACLGFPIWAAIASIFIHIPRREFWLSHVRSIRADLVKAIFQMAVLVACLPYKASLMVDAIARTLTRQFITRRKLLEWETAATTEGRLSKRPSAILTKMSWVTIATAIAMVTIPLTAWTAAAPWLLLWILSPLMAYGISRPFPQVQTRLCDEDKTWLRMLVKSSWSYFEACVGPKTNWLPPDNLQEYPEEKLAERISPTNEGLFLVSALVARDFGFVGLQALLELCEKNLAAWRRLPQLNGHFFNWYDTSSLQPLTPRYISTVDSGNLAASLLVLERGMVDICRSPVFGDPVWEGLHDTISLTIQSCERLHPRGARMMSPPLDGLTESLNKHRDLLTSFPQSWPQRHAMINDHLRKFQEELPVLLQALVDARRHPTTEVEAHVHNLVALLSGVAADSSRLIPWVETSVSIQRRFEHNTPEDPLSTAWFAIQTRLEQWQSVDDFTRIPDALSDEIATMMELAQSGNATFGDGLAQELALFRKQLEAASKAATEIKSRSHSIGTAAEQIAFGMKFDFLFNPERQLFAIGFNLEDGKADRSHYDLLCSEARLASHFAIAKGDVDYKHWFHLGRQSTITASRPGLLSWGGTMFEFLMPLLFQRSFPGSLLTQACETAVARQQEYGRENAVPWGVSESAFASLAVNTDYNYRSFGVPGLGLKRGLGDDMVVAPYATMLALTICAEPAALNLRRLASEGALGSYGFYDAIDYSPARVPVGRQAMPVRCYMAHHQAMSILAIANVLKDQIIERRFHEHPMIKATESLLQESIPVAVPVILPNPDETTEVRPTVPETTMVSRRLVGYETPFPRTHLLSNGVYSVMVTNTGGGYSQRGDINVGRWRSDGLNDQGGQFLYIRDRRTGQVWSATYQPTCKKPDFYEVVYSVDKAEFRRCDGDIETTLEIVVSPDNNVEHRQLKITNRGWQTRELEITSFVELSLTTAAADIAHPAFQKLFIETEYVPEETALIAKRRPRAPHEDEIWAFHVLASPDLVREEVQHESSRQEFIGRGRDLRSPAAIQLGNPLSETMGAVIDPIFSLRCNVTIERNVSVSLAFTTGIADSRQEVLRLSDQFHEQRSVLRAFELAWVFNQVQLHHMHLTAAKAQRFQQLASLILFPQPQVRGSESAIRNNHQGQKSLWRFGISGDRPILLVNVAEAEHVEFVRELVLAHQYWEHHGLTVDLVIVNTHPGSYLDVLQEILQDMIQEAPHQIPDTKKNSIFLLRASQLPLDDRWLLEATARVVIEARRGWLTVVPQPMKRSAQPPVEAQRKPVIRSKSVTNGHAPSLRADQIISQAPKATKPVAGSRISDDTPRDHLEFWNGFGGFAQQGTEYHILLRSSHPTPAPWSNIIANPGFGCLITESGAGYTWAGNSRQNKLTTWSNDPVCDPPSEVLYLRDVNSNETWLPMWYPDRNEDEVWAQHGQGYSRFVRADKDLEQEVRVTIDPVEPVKFIFVKVRNTGAAERRLTASYYADFVLGVNRDETQMQLVSEIDTDHDALLMRNAYQLSFPRQVAFLKVIGSNRSLTADRVGFLGRQGNLRDPQELGRGSLSNKTGAGLDPCGVVQSQFTIASGETKEIVFLLGCGSDSDESRRLLDRYQSLDQCKMAESQTSRLWETVLTSVQVKTPNRAFDLLVNRWLLYQVLSCRFWGRSAFYQSGGAFGFRDQLQDAMALVYSRPDLTRAQILNAASRQYEEGDVQHWWHPPIGEGTRTRFSDDLLWLPFVTAQYVKVTGDRAVLDEVVGYLASPVLAPGEQERYELPQCSSKSGSLYEHCILAIDRGFRLGDHGLPLMGCGDWNDGMNHVGSLGRGESVWVGWFLLRLIDDFLPLMELHGGDELARSYRDRTTDLRRNLELHAWDGEWYRRAYFDDGTPLGSWENDECQIDSIAQSWAVLSEADPNRTDKAIKAVFERLVSADDRLVKLFAPPFDTCEHDPGYIKGYLPGVRENGGQYTHAVLWLIQALTIKGDADRAMELFDYVNPILHSRDENEVRKYRVEPYVIAADVYSLTPHAGRGGWSWYTGSAAWTYRVALESMLGLCMQGDRVHFTPCVPSDWTTFQVTIRKGESTWRFTVDRSKKRENSDDQPDGMGSQQRSSDPVELIDDGGDHSVVVRFHQGQSESSTKNTSKSNAGPDPLMSKKKTPVL